MADRLVYLTGAFALSSCSGESATPLVATRMAVAVATPPTLEADLPGDGLEKALPGLDEVLK